MRHWNNKTQNKQTINKHISHRRWKEVIICEIFVIRLQTLAHHSTRCGLHPAGSSRQANKRRAHTRCRWPNGWWARATAGRALTGATLTVRFGVLFIALKWEANKFHYYIMIIPLGAIFFFFAPSLSGGWWSEVRGGARTRSIALSPWPSHRLTPLAGSSVRAGAFIYLLLRCCLVPFFLKLSILFNSWSLVKQTPFLPGSSPLASCERWNDKQVSV